MVLTSLAGSVLNIYAGRNLVKNSNRTLIFITSGLNCANLPFGLLLGIATIVVLCRSSAKEMFGEKKVVPELVTSSESVDRVLIDIADPDESVWIELEKKSIQKEN